MEEFPYIKKKKIHNSNIHNMDISTKEDYETFERLHETWYLENNKPGPIEYIVFLENVLENNVHQLWAIWEIDPIEYYLENTETEFPRIIEELPDMLHLLEEQFYFFSGSAYQKKKGISKIMSTIRDYNCEEAINKKEKEQCIMIGKLFFKKLEKHREDYSGGLQKDIYLELISDLISDLLNWYNENENDARDIYLFILQFVFFSKELDGNLYNSNVFDKNYMRPELYADLCEFLFQNDNGISLGFQYIIGMSKIHKENAKSLISNHWGLMTENETLELEWAVDSIVLLMRKLPILVKIWSMKRRIPFMKYKKGMIEELRILPTGYITEHYPGGEVYCERMREWSNQD